MSVPERIGVRIKFMIKYYLVIRIKVVFYKVKREYLAWRMRRLKARIEREKEKISPKG